MMELFDSWGDEHFSETEQHVKRPRNQSIGRYPQFGIRKICNKDAEKLANKSPFTWILVMPQLSDEWHLSPIKQAPEELLIL